MIWTSSDSSSDYWILLQPFDNLSCITSPSEVGSSSSLVVVVMAQPNETYHEVPIPGNPQWRYYPHAARTPSPRSMPEGVEWPPSPLTSGLPLTPAQRRAAAAAGQRLPLLFILPGLSEVPFGTWLIWIQHLHMSMKMMTSSKLLNGKLPTMFSCRRRLRHQTSQCIPRGLQVPVFLDTWYSLFWNWTKTDDWQWVIIFSRVRLNHELPSPLLY